MIHLPNFKPFFGLVEDIADPLQIGRVRIRVFCLHEPSIPVDQLPWMSTIVSNSAGHVGLGSSPTGYTFGSTVFGYIVDTDMQRGFIVGSLTGMPQPFLFSDVNKLGRDLRTYIDPVNGDEVQEPEHWLKEIRENARYVDIQTGQSKEKWDEIEYENNSVYPLNNIFESKSGHIKEIDDTIENQRIHEYHRSGTYTEIVSSREREGNSNTEVKDGTRTVKVVGDGYELIAGDKHIYIGGNVNLTIDGDVNEYIKGNKYVQIDGDKTEIVQGAVKQRFGNLTTKVFGNISSDANMQYHQTGRANGLASLSTTIPSQYNVEFALPTILEFGRFSEFDDQETIHLVPPNYPEDPVNPNDAGEVVNEADVDDQPIEVEDDTECLFGTTISERTKLTTNFNIGDLTVNVAVRRGVHKIRQQNGFSVSQIACNMKALCENILEPLRAKFGPFRINSGFRTGTARSQHNKGMAVDIQEPSWGNTKLLEVAEWAAKNLPCDQIIFEHGNSCWLHLSFDKTKTTQRGQKLTMYKGRFEPGLKLYYR